MHAMKLPALAPGAGGAPALLFPVMRESALACDIGEETIEIGDKTDIGKAICFWQALVEPGQPMRLKFTDGGTWIGGVVLTREEEDDVAVTVEGRIFNGQGDERGLSLSFRCEPDGPVGLPIIVRDIDGCVIGYYTDDGSHDAPLGKDAKAGAVFAGASGDLTEDAETQRAAFFAAGTSFTTANAPEIKPAPPMGGYQEASAKAGAALQKAAKAAMGAWLPDLGRTQGKRGGNNGDKWFRFQGKTLVEMAPGETIPRRMPRPERRPVVAKPAKGTDKPATETRAVVKRVRGGGHVPMVAR